MTEAELQDAVIELAHLFGWRVAHFRAARTKSGWATPVAADGKGFPDLMMARRERLIFAELKSAKGKLTLEQEEWMSALRHTGSTLAVWYPRDWESGVIEDELRSA